MQKGYLKFLESVSKKFRKENKEIFDIVIYGSFVKGSNFRDIDIMIIFKDTQLETRLGIAQDLKFIIKKKIENADVKTMNFGDFFDQSFFARQGLLIEGLSIVRNKPLAYLFGFKGFGLFSYNLKNLDHNKKVQFTYALSGRNSKGVLSSLNGISLGRGAVKIPIEHSNEFEDFLQRWNISSKKSGILESRL